MSKIKLISYVLNYLRNNHNYLSLVDVELCIYSKYRDIYDADKCVMIVRGMNGKDKIGTRKHIKVEKGTVGELFAIVDELYPSRLGETYIRADIHIDYTIQRTTAVIEYYKNTRRLIKFDGLSTLIVNKFVGTL